MDLEQEEMFENLSKWIVNSIGLSSDSVSLPCLITGRPIAEALAIIEPDYFDESWLEKIRRDGLEESNSNWRVKVSNLRKIVKGMFDFYESLGKPLPKTWSPDINAIARDEDRTALNHLLQILVGVAVNCKNKQTFIVKTMELEESVQSSIMLAIKTVTEKMESQSGTDEKLRQLTDELNALKEEYNEVFRRCEKLDQQVLQLHEEKRNLMAEKETLMGKLSEAGNLEDPSSPVARKVLRAQTTVERIQDELYKAEAVNDDLNAKLEGATSENEELKLRVGELAEMEHKYQMMKDEADELRIKAESASKLEAILETYRRKVEELSGYKTQLKIMEEKNENYMQSVIDLEEEQRKNSTLKVQLEAYKRQTQDLESKLTAQERRADKAEFERKRAGEKLLVLEDESNRIRKEHQALRDLSDELRSANTSLLGSDEEAALNEASTIDGSILVGATPLELREKVLRLMAENQRFKENDGEELKLLQDQLEDVQARKQELETEARLSHQKNMELESRLNDLQELEEKKRAGGDARLAAIHQEAEKRSVQTEQFRRHGLDLERQLLEKDEMLKQLKVQCDAKDVELKSYESKLKSYMDKARTTIVGLESRILSRTSSSLSGEVSADHRKDLERKNAEINRLKEEMEKTKVLFDQEHKLVLSYFNNQAVEAGHEAALSRFRESGAGAQSLLGRHRQIQTPQRPFPLSNNFTSRLFAVFVVVVVFGLSLVMAVQSEQSGSLMPVISELFQASLSVHNDGTPPPV